MQRNNQATSLMNMPDDVMRMIMEMVDFVTILNLRKVCKPLRDFIDFDGPRNQLSELYITTRPDSIRYALSFRGFHYICIRYVRLNKGNSLIKKETSYNYEDSIFYVKSNFLDAFSHDFGIILKSQRTALRQLKMEIYDEPYGPYEEDFKYLKEELHIEPPGTSESVVKKAFDSLESILKSRKSPLSVNVLALPAVTKEQLMQILPHINIKKLEKFEVPSKDVILRAVGQYLMSRRGCIPTRVVTFGTVTIDEIHRLMNDTDKPPGYIEIRYDAPYAIQGFLEELGRPSGGEVRPNEWYHQIPGSDKTMFIKVLDKMILLKREEKSK